MEHTGNIKMEAENRNYQNKQKVLQYFLPEVNDCIIDGGG
jgi:hypothetical protein